MRVAPLPGRVEPELGLPGAGLGRQAVRPAQAGLPVRPVAQLREVTCAVVMMKCYTFPWYYKLFIFLP